MTVLRSREIAPPIKSQSSLETLRKGAIEPATPPKTLEQPNHAVCGTPNSTASTPSAPPVGLGSYSVRVVGAARRRSARLASVSSVDEIAPNIVVSNRKRKTVGAKNSIGRNIEPLLENIGGDVVGITENRGKKGRDFDRIGMDRVSGELAIAMEVEEKERTEERKLDLNTSLVSDGKEKGQRQLGNGGNLLALELAREGGSDKGFLNLRSGKKICKGKMEIKSGDVGFAELVSDDGDKSVSVNGGEDEDKASGKSGGIEKGVLMDKFIRDVGGDELGNLKGRRRSSGALMPKADDWGERLELDLNCEVELPAGSPLSDTGHLPGNVGLNALDKGETNDEIGPGVKARRRLSLELKGKGIVVGDGLLSNGNAVSDTIQTPENGGHLPADDSRAVKSRRISREEKGKGKVVGNELLSNGNAISDTAHLPENVGLKTLKKDSPADDIHALKSRRRISREEKGKGKVVEDGLLSNGIDAVELGLEPSGRNSTKKSVSKSPSLPNGISVQDESQIQAVGTGARANVTRESDYKVRFREIAKQNASRFAHFSSEEAVENHVTDEPESQMPIREAEREIEDWPGPFSTAMKIIKDREMNVNLSQKSSFLDKSKPASVLWVPKKDQQLDHSKQSIPQLQDLCMEILAKNADAITSLWGVPDVLRHRLSQLLCDSRRMNSNFLDLLVQVSPTEIRIRDCSWLTEEQFTRTFQGCEASNLMVLQLDQCGRCMPDYVLFATLARLPNSLPALTTISLKGACRLSDVGLSALVASAPVLRSINLSQCSLLTSVGIHTLADSLGPVLRELYLDDCQSIDPMLILPALSKLEHLEVLSLAGIQTVCDDFVSKFIALCGHNIKELVLADCVTLTDSSLKVIAEYCAGLCALDLGKLYRLTDSTLGYLANGCRAIQTLKLCRNSFSDEAVAAYLEASGEFLKELSLNNITKVGHNTAVSLARRSRKLCCLDLSWCRNLTNEALGLIVDSCLSLKVLKLFGCTQITSVFLDGHSNPQVQIIGLKMTPILKHLKVPDPLEGPLHYSSVSS